MTESLSSLRSDIGDAKCDLDEFGYCILLNVLGDAELGVLHSELYMLAEKERQNGDAWFSNGNQRIFTLENKSSLCLALIEHPIALELASHVLGQDRILSSITANIALPGNVPQALHADQQFMPEPWAWPATTNVVWLVDPFTQENGGTKIVLATHRVGTRPYASDIPAISVEAPAGSILCIDGRVWHGTGQNTGPTSRCGIFADYCAPFIRPKENVFRSLSSDVRATLSLRLRQLLGYDVWLGIGVVNGLPREWMGSGKRSGQTNADGLF